jgi:hypothetical protein
MAAARGGRLEARGLGFALVANLAFMMVALLVGPERVRVFAENGTLLNRLLMQLWPLGVLVIWFGLSAPRAARAAGGH